MERIDGRALDELRPVQIRTEYLEVPDGSVLISTGKTRVLCAASIEDSVPEWMERNQVPGGWVTAEYAMLPAATDPRGSREVDGWSGRTQEIRRLIGRSLRASIYLDQLGPRTCIVDCDVLQADGGTRTAAISGGYVALAAALQKLIAEEEITEKVFRPRIAATSVGMVDGQPMLDLCYREDARADVDINVVMNATGELIEIQGTAEGEPFSRSQLETMLDMAHGGIQQLFHAQQEAL